MKGIFKIVGNLCVYIEKEGYKTMDDAGKDAYNEYREAVGGKKNRMDYNETYSKPKVRQIGFRAE